MSAALLLLFSFLLSGCLPNRFVIDLAGSDGNLLEKTVLTDAGANTGSKVALINVDGLISHTAGGGLIASRTNAVDELVARLSRAEQDPSVRAIIIRINSPGGTVAASETMYHELRGFRERTGKPVIISMAEIAASGGYYIALAGDHIMAQPSTITGSIGVIIQTVNFSKGMAKIGIEARSVTSAGNKDLANPFEPMEEAHYTILMSTVTDFYDSFRTLVRDRRPEIRDDEMAMLTDGRIFTGRQALSHHLIDSNGDVRDAFAEARRRAGLERARLVTYHQVGRVPTSAYASAVAPEPASGSASQINLLQLNLPDTLRPSAGFYYLWWPGAL